MRKAWVVLLAGLALILGGAYLASRIQTSGGIKVDDVRFAGADGVLMSGLLYTPKTATPDKPAPGILAVHGYINSRETQAGFAIEFARRGYVVLAMDQTGHGYSGGAAFSQGFGGPAGLSYLRSLPMVDKANIGLEGHSMGGWTVLAAAAAMPDAYKAIVLEGSSTGAPFAAEGSPTWPRNLGLVFSQYDEFSKIMWNVDRAKDVTSSEKLKAVFGTTQTIVPGRIYGQIANGTARRLSTPATTHPGDHFSPEAIGYSLDWFAKTLTGGTPLPANNQIWIWKEVGTGIGLIGFVLLLLGTFDVLLGLAVFAGLNRAAIGTYPVRDGGWWRRFWIMALVPIVTYFPAFMLVTLFMKPSSLLPQTISNQVLVWALINTAITLGLGLVDRRRAGQFDNRWGLSVLISLLTVGIGYAVVAATAKVFTTDLRFWVLALKPFSAAQLQIAPVYLVGLTVFFLVALKALHEQLAIRGDAPINRYVAAIGAMALGFALLLGLDYGVFFVTGSLPTRFDPLSTVVAMQFLPLMAMVAVISVFTWRRTHSYVPGALICALFVTWYLVAGTATQVV
jgi:pimeloyl-ACP methyl ester carboxylesterase